MLVVVVWWRFKHWLIFPSPTMVSSRSPVWPLFRKSIDYTARRYVESGQINFIIFLHSCPSWPTPLLIDARAPQPFDFSLHRTYQTKPFFFFPGPNDVLLQQLVWPEFQFQPRRRRLLRQSGTQTRVVSIRGCELYTSLIKIRDSAMTGPLALMPQRGFAAHSSVIVHFEIIA